MDSLSHGLTGQVVGALWKPKDVSKVRWFCTCFILANLPDIDFLCFLFGRDFYHFQHRGLTHSFLGLLLMIPLGLFIFRKIMGKNILAFKHQVLCVSSQIIFSHLLLDYLTSYGVMFLFPFSLARFAHPVMFIIDWMVWSVLISLCITLWWVGKYKFRRLKRTAIAGIMILFSLWLTQDRVKNLVENQFIAQLTDQNYIDQTTSKNLITNSYPKWKSLWHWHLVGLLPALPENNSKEMAFQGEALAQFPNLNFDIRIIPAPPEYSINALCSSPDLNFDEEKKQNFLRYKKWAVNLACAEKTINQARGCQCFILKYNVLGERLGFGNYWIPVEGNSRFL